MAHANRPGIQGNTQLSSTDARAEINVSKGYKIISSLEVALSYFGFSCGSERTIAWSSLPRRRLQCFRWRFRLKLLWLPSSTRWGTANTKRFSRCIGREITRLRPFRNRNVSKNQQNCSSGNYKTLPQDRELLDSLCIRLSQTLKIELLRPVEPPGRRRSAASPRALTCCHTVPPGYSGQKVWIVVDPHYPLQELARALSAVCRVTGLAAVATAMVSPAWVTVQPPCRDTSISPSACRALASARPAPGVRSAAFSRPSTPHS